MELPVAAEEIPIAVVTPCEDAVAVCPWVKQRTVERRKLRAVLQGATVGIPRQIDLVFYELLRKGVVAAVEAQVEIHVKMVMIAAEAEMEDDEIIVEELVVMADAFVVALVV